jgi:hypothetical protein
MLLRLLEGHGECQINFVVGNANGLLGQLLFLSGTGRIGETKRRLQRRFVHQFRLRPGVPGIAWFEARRRRLPGKRKPDKGGDDQCREPDECPLPITCMHAGEPSQQRKYILIWNGARGKKAPGQAEAKEGAPSHIGSRGIWLKA